MSRTRTVSGVIATAALVLLFGNQAVTEWVANHYPDANSSVWSWFLHQLTWPAWAFGPRNDSAGAGRQVLADDLRALLLIAFVAALLAMVASSVNSGAGGFIVGWASLIFGSALAAFLTAFILSNPTFLNALQQAGTASAYGLFVGWIVGIATAGKKKDG